MPPRKGEAQRLATIVVERVLSGETLPSALDSVAPAQATGRRRALVQELCFGTVRHWGLLDALVRRLAAKPFADPVLGCLVAVAIYQLLHTRAPPFAVVDHAVNAAAMLTRPAAKGLVNALLRRFLRERDALLLAVQSDPVARWSHPRWWVERVEREFPLEWQDVLAADNTHAPLTLRVNRRRASRDECLAQFEQAGIAAVPAGDDGIIVDPPMNVRALPGFDAGAFSVQDLGAQLAAPLLAPLAGDHILDACAAPGGKATHLLELADIDLVALDNDGDRLARVDENLERLGLDRTRVQVVLGDAGTPQAWWDGRPFDRILADVPCTAAGVVRRHPDIKWLRREADLEGFARQQARLLDALWGCLAHGGVLLYATCSIFEAENEAQVAAFLARHGGALRETLTFPPEALRRGAQLLPSLPGASHNQDGYFYALLRKA
jgi:16S rRNA (cytosine967-C5)-methyltransferase